MFDLRLVGTPVVEFLSWRPEFLDPDVRIAEIYMVAKSELPVAEIVKGGEEAFVVDMEGFCNKHYDELITYCSEDELKTILSSSAGNEFFGKLGVVAYGLYKFSVRVSAVLRQYERSGIISFSNDFSAPNGMVIH
jgi:hypothetical protein